MDNRLGEVENRLAVVDYMQKKTSDQVRQLKIAVDNMNWRMDRDYHRLLDGIETIEEVLRRNTLIPR